MAAAVVAAAVAALMVVVAVAIAVAVLVEFPHVAAHGNFSNSLQMLPANPP